MLQCVAERCSVLQSVALCCRALQCVAERCSVLQSVALCCRALQCVAERCSVNIGDWGPCQASLSAFTERLREGARKSCI